MHTPLMTRDRRNCRPARTHARTHVYMQRVSARRWRTSSTVSRSATTTSSHRAASWRAWARTRTPRATPRAAPRRRSSTSDMHACMPQPPPILVFVRIHAPVAISTRTRAATFTGTHTHTSSSAVAHACPTPLRSSSRSPSTMSATIVTQSNSSAPLCHLLCRCCIADHITSPSCLLTALHLSVLPAHGITPLRPACSQHCTSASRLLTALHLSLLPAHGIAP